MNRRDFIKAFAGGIATVAIGMRLARGMPEVLADGYKYTTYSTGFAGTGERYAAALARSMMQTREVVAANVLNNIFPEYEHRTFHTERLDEVISGEGARRSVGVEGSPDRI